MRLGLIGGDVDKSSVSGIFTPEERVAYEKTTENLQNYYYNSKTKSIAAQDSAAGDLFFSTDGTKAYLLGTTNNTVYQYTLSTPWDISTATYESKSFVFSASLGDTNIQGIFITPDGIDFYVLGALLDRIYYFKLTTPWDISTARQINSYDASTQVPVGTATGVKFDDSGTKMYILSSSTNEVVYQYTLSTAYDIFTASYASKSLTITTQDSAMTDIAFSSDGTKLYASGDTNNIVYQYTLSTAWDISTGSYASKSLAVGTQGTFPNAICFGNSGSILYVLDDSTNTIYQYTLGTPWDISTGSYASKSVSTYINNYYWEATPHGIDISSDGTKIYFIGQSSGAASQSKVFVYNLTTPWDLSTANTSISPSVTSQDTSGTGIRFNTDGTKMYMVGSNTIPVSIYQYSLTPAWNIGTLTYDNVKLNVSGQDTLPQGFCFNRNGTKLIMIGMSNDKIYQYNLTTPWDLSTASFVRSISISTLELNGRSVVLSNDGNKIYMVGDNSDTIHQYDLVFS